jgi:hypothetical protein
MTFPYEVKPITAEQRSEWDDGPWNSEPDLAAWTMTLQGHTLYCAIIRHTELGHLCGYVGVDDKHPAYRADTSWEGDFSPECHGGITFSNTRDNVRWFGFDCAHGWDVHPYKALRYAGTDAVYRTFDYVMGEVRSLAAYVAKYGQKPDDAGDEEPGEPDCSGIEGSVP